MCSSFLLKKYLFLVMLTLLCSGRLAAHDEPSVTLVCHDDESLRYKVPISLLVEFYPSIRAGFEMTGRHHFDEESPLADGQIVEFFLEPALFIALGLGLSYFYLITCATGEQCTKFQEAFYQTLRELPSDDCAKALKRTYKDYLNRLERQQNWMQTLREWQWSRSCLRAYLRYECSCTCGNIAEKIAMAILCATPSVLIGAIGKDPKVALIVLPGVFVGGVLLSKLVRLLAPINVPAASTAFN